MNKRLEELVDRLIGVLSRRVHLKNLLCLNSYEMLFE